MSDLVTESLRERNLQRQESLDGTQVQLKLADNRDGVDFGQALDWLKLGYMVARKLWDWNDNVVYLRLVDEEIVVFNGDDSTIFCASSADLLANDWVKHNLIVREERRRKLKDERHEFRKGICDLFQVPFDLVFPNQTKEK